MGEMISLSKEVELINNFIELQKDRFEGRVKVAFEHNQINDSSSVPPMILISLVENAFKHSLRNELGMAYIDIQLKTQSNQIIFRVKNSKPESDNLRKLDKNGIGLQNIRRRLDLLYDDNYTLEIMDNSNEFYVQLELNSN